MNFFLNDLLYGYLYFFSHIQKFNREIGFLQWHLGHHGTTGTHIGRGEPRQSLDERDFIFSQFLIELWENNEGEDERRKMNTVRKKRKWKEKESIDFCLRFFSILFSFDREENRWGQNEKEGRKRERRRQPQETEREIEEGTPTKQSSVWFFWGHD